MTDKNAAVALMVLARYLASKDPGFPEYLKKSLDHASDAGLSVADLTLLKTIVGAVIKRD